MGRDKASLPFGSETLLERVVRIIEPVVDELWLVAREDQSIELDRPIARDSAEGLGPLAGLSAGLGVMRSERALLISCDVPLFSPRFAEKLFELSMGHAAAVPFIDGHCMTTTAVYTRDCLPVARRLLDEGRRRPRELVRAVDARIVEESELREVDPQLYSVLDCNTPDAYRRALELAGLDTSVDS